MVINPVTTSPVTPEPAVAEAPRFEIAVLAKAPIPGFAKTRLIPLLGPQGAARLQRWLLCRTLGTVAAAELGRLTLWCSPNIDHPDFLACREIAAVELRVQPEADLGERMLHAARQSSAQVGTLIVGTDCPLLDVADLQRVAAELDGGAEVVVIPAEDGGYVLIALRHPYPALFAGVAWSTPEVLEQTRQRALTNGLRLVELAPRWDVDLPADYLRLLGHFPELAAVCQSSDGGAKELPARPAWPDVLPPRREIVGLLLAAGTGSRFGNNKLLHRLPDGTPMALAAARQLIPACDRVMAVIRPDQAALSELLHGAGCATIVCADAAGGMGHSLAAGVKATPDVAGWVVALADMPFIQTGSHRAVAAALRDGASLAATSYQGRRGHPVGFAREWLPRLLLLTGDQGGKDILAEHRDRLRLCPVDDRGVLLDIDRPGDLDGVTAG